MRGVLDWSVSEDRIELIAVVSDGLTIIASSVVGTGNTAHWIEKHAICEESAISNSINLLYAKTVDIGGFVLETGKDFVDFFKHN